MFNITRCSVNTLFRKPLTYVAIASAAGLGTAATNADLFEMSKNVEIFATLYKEINTYYVDDVNPGDFMHTAIDAGLKSLDPYTQYYSESEIEDVRFMTTGQYGGVGAIISVKDEYIQITEPYDGYPAQKAGLYAGDLILEVDGKSTKGKTTEDVSKLLKGQPGSDVTLLIKRGDGETLTKTLKREEVKVKNVPYYGMVNDKVGYIKLTGFTQEATKEVRNALVELKKNNPTSIILDLRSNPGGLLTEAVNISNLFIPKGKLAVSTKGKVKEWDRDYNTAYEPVDTTTPIAVLINGNSASASEIVSGVIQDYDRGVVIGQKSYGKGLVQSTRPLAYNTQLKVTTAKYYIPSGRCIQALDYADRDENKQAKRTADSLRRAFKTKVTGRVVYDAGGITPDVAVDVTKYPPIASALLSKRLIFDYANSYKAANATKTIDAKTFQLSDSEWKAFVAWLEKKEYDYTTETDKALKALKEKAEKDDAWKAIASEFKALEAKVGHDKAQDLVKFRAEVEDLLEEEIASRYGLQSARIQASFDDDADLTKALAVLNNPAEYRKLTGR